MRKAISVTVVFGALSLVLGDHQCKPGEYWSDVIDGCDSCDTFCKFKEIQGTEKECRTRCPGYGENPARDPGASGPNNTGIVVAGTTVVSAVLLLAVIIVVVAIVVRRRRQAQHPQPLQTVTATDPTSPIIAQCTEDFRSDSVTTAQTGNEDDEDKVLMAHADLPRHG